MAEQTLVRSHRCRYRHCSKIIATSDVLAFDFGCIYGYTLFLLPKNHTKVVFLANSLKKSLTDYTVTCIIVDKKGK